MKTREEDNDIVYKNRLMNRTKEYNGCLEYTGAISSSGYGVFHMYGKSVNSHKASYILNKGETGEMLVLHKCDNKKCINPDHLYLGTRLQNANDAIERGQMPIGERHGRRTHPESFLEPANKKISNNKALEMLNSNISARNLAKANKVHISTIYRAKHRADALINELNKE